MITIILIQRQEFCFFNGSLSPGSVSRTEPALPRKESRIMECHTIECTIQKFLNGEPPAANPPPVHRSMDPSGGLTRPRAPCVACPWQINPKLFCVPHIPHHPDTLPLRNTTQEGNSHTVMYPKTPNSPKPKEGRVLLHPRVFTLPLTSHSHELCTF